MKNHNLINPSKEEHPMKLTSRLSIAAGVAVLAATSLTIVPSASARGGGDRIPVVRTRTLVLKGSAGYVDVRIPRRTAIDTSLARYRGSSGPNRHTRISGDGPFTGILIAPLNDQLGAGKDRIAVVGRFEGCSYGCADARKVNFAFPLFTDQVVLPPNVYRISFMGGDGASRVAVTFLSGRWGKTFLTPRHEIAFSAAVPAAAGSSTPNVFSAGADYELPENGIRFSVMDLALADRGSDATYGTCLYQSLPAEADEYKFQPGCPEGTPAYRRVTQSESLARRFAVAEWEYIYGAGPWAFGMWHQSDIDIESVLHGSVFLGI